MNYIKINPSELSGEVKIPSSKSICHRSVICAGLSEGISNIDNVIFSEDIEATCEGMKALGAKIEKYNDHLKIEGIREFISKNLSIYCGESGSTLRFLIPIGAVVGEEITFKGIGKLVERPLQPYYDIFDDYKIKYENIEGKLPLTIKGKLKPGKYFIRGDVSSQFISGLLFSLPILKGDSKIIVTTRLESKPYVDLTIDMLKNFSIDIYNKDYREFIIKGNQKYIKSNYRVEGDFSQAAFWLTAGIIGKDVICSGLNMDSLQGDKVILDIIKSMGGKISIEEDKVKAIYSKTKGTVIDVSQCPDLVPILAVLASLSEGTTEIINAARLRIKESDRLKAISGELNKIGADIEEKEEGLIIRGKKALNGGVVDSWNDHRIAMALAIASIRCKEPVIIKKPLSIKKSYPNFWEDFTALGGNIDSDFNVTTIGIS